MYTHVEQIKCDKVAIRIDIVSEEKIDSLLTDMNFLNYRLAGVERTLDTEKEKPDLLWLKEERPKSIEFKNEQVILKGDWFEGEIQKVLVSFIASKLYALDRYLFHASAVNYRGKTIMFMGGEGNSGKTMSQIEACNRGATIVSTETLLMDGEGNVLLGSKNVFLKVRAKGTERIDKPNQDEGVDKFFDKRPVFEIYDKPTKIDVVVLPDMDGNYATVVGEMGAFEREYQTFHCLGNYMGSDLLLASGIPMPLFDNEELRAKRADFIKKFANQTYTYIRGTGPKVVLDEVDKIL